MVVFESYATSENFCFGNRWSDFEQTFVVNGYSGDVIVHVCSQLGFTAGMNLKIPWVQADDVRMKRKY